MSDVGHDDAWDAPTILTADFMGRANGDAYRRVLGL